MTNSPLIVVTPGDPDGVGPEICWKSASQKGCRLLFVGARKPFDEMGSKVIEVQEKDLFSGDFQYPAESQAPFIWLLAAPTRAPKKKLLLEGYQSGWSIEKAVQLIQAGVAQAVSTGPISKERLQKGGFKYPGHTEFLADLCARQKGKNGKAKKLKRDTSEDVTMMLANDQLRVSLVTTHIGLKTVSRHLTRAKIRRAVLHTADHLRRWWGISKPRIAIAALNPHAGESGLFGSEEIRVITPEIRALQKLVKNTAAIEGPIPADTLFAKNLLASPENRYDAVVCMYHDQGLIPVKLLDFRKTVNVTLGLPIIRTSVDHGVGFDIAKTGKADPSSLQAAIQLALEIVELKK
jgi:4-hydroxythreonine-4-phosphate dehydrogenase